MRRIAIWNGTREAWESPMGSIDLFSTHSDVYLETWPSSGTWDGGSAFELPMPALPTVDSGSSFLPTPQAHDAQGGETPEQVAAMRAKGHGVWNLNEVVFPTPRASRGASGTETMYRLGAVRDDSTRPQGQVLLKTPTSQLAVNGGSQHPDKRKEGGHGPTLADEVEHLLPTPVVTDAAGTRNATAVRKNPNSKHHSGSTLADVLLPTPAAMNPNDGERLETWEARRVRTKERVKNGNGFGTPLAIAVQMLPGASTSQPSDDGKPSAVA